MKRVLLLAVLTALFYLAAWKAFTLIQINGNPLPGVAGSATSLQFAWPRLAQPRPRQPGVGPNAPLPAALEPAAAPNGAAPTAQALQESLQFFMAGVDLSAYYPAAARQRGIQGKVLLELTLGEGFQVTGVRLAEPGPHPLLEQAAQRLISEQGYKISSFLLARHGTGFAGGAVLLPLRFALL